MRARVGRVTPASVRSSQWLTRRCCEADSDRQNRQNLNDFLQRQATDMESHDAPTPIPGDDRLYPNPAELLAAFERLATTRGSVTPPDNRLRNSRQ